MKLYTPNLEERAFLYQEAQALEPMMKDLGSLSVLVEEVTPEEDNATAVRRFRVTFMVAPESVAMRIQATGKNLFAATIAAREEATRQLNALLNNVPREALLEAQKNKIPPGWMH